MDYHAVFDTISCVDEFAYIGRETESWSLEYLEPSLLVQTILSQSPTASEYFALALAQYEGTKMNPLSCVIGFDEFQSGSLNRPDSSKKYMCLYFTFLELSLPSQDLLWFCPQVSRTVKLGQIVGGWSHVLARFLKRMFLGPCGFSTTGVTFAYKNRDYIFYAKLQVLLSDGDGLRQAIGWRGAGSIRPSIIHDNVLMKASDLVSRTDGYVEIGCCEARLLHKTTTLEFENRCDLVEAVYKRHHVDKTLSKRLFDEIIKVESLNYIPRGLAFDRELRGQVDFFSAITVDWMHTWLQDGVLTTEVFLLLGACNLPVSGLVAFLQQPWQFPFGKQGKGSKLWKVFEDRRLDAKGEVDKVRSTASELLGVMTLIRHYVAIHVDHIPALAPHWKSFKACCKVLDLILVAKRATVSPRGNAGALRKLLEDFMTSHVACYGESHLKPKHAWQWALIWHWLRDDMVFDAFVVERLHLQIKAIAERIDDTTRGERSVLSGVVMEQMAELKKFHSPCCLLGRTFRCDDFPNAVFANKMAVWGSTYAVGCVIFHQGIAGMLLACALDDGELVAVIEKFTFVVQLSPNGAQWTRSDTVAMVRAADLNMARLVRSRRSFLKS